MKTMNFEILEVIILKAWWSWNVFKVFPWDKTLGIVNPVFTGTGIILSCLKTKSHTGIEINAENPATDLLHDFEEGILTCLCQFSHL